MTATLNTLNTSKTPGIIVSEICMMRSTFNGVHFLVEGEDDSRFWKHYLKRQNVSLVDCGGRPNLIGATHKIDQAAITGVAGVYDPDFDRLHGTPPHAPHILVQTDANDLETTLLTSAALAKLLAEYADTTLLVAFESSRGVSVLEHIERTASEFGRLRFLNSVAGYRVDFAKLSPYRFVSKDDWSLDLAGLKTAFAALASISLAALEAALLADCPHATPWAYCQGHDAVRILAQGLLRTIGRHQMNEQDVTRLLRAIYNDTMLKQTAMYASLCAIEPTLPAKLFAW
jgi:Protein of unknown function (DUF4435)